MSRESIFQEIDAERNRQCEMWGGPEHDDRLSAADWIVILARHLGLAAYDGLPDDGPRPPSTAERDEERLCKQMTRLAAVAVAALESAARRREAARLGAEAARLAWWQRSADEAGKVLLLLPHGSPKRYGEGPDMPYGVREEDADEYEKRNYVLRLVPSSGVTP